MTGVTSGTQFVPGTRIGRASPAVILVAAAGAAALLMVALGPKSVAALAAMAGAAAIVVGMRWVTGGGLEGPEFLALLALLGASAEAVRKTSDIWNKIQQANAAAERVFGIIDRQPEEERPSSHVTW